MSITERFWPYVNKTDACWLWTGGTRGHGYGQMHHSWNGGAKKNIAAHRASWEIHNGPIPAGLQVLHRCDVPLCVNPEHLFLGTRKDNMIDMTAKRRRVGPSGERHHNAKLTEADVREIRRLFAAGAACRALARRYGLSRNTMTNVVRGETWKHVA